MHIDQNGMPFMLAVAAGRKIFRAVRWEDVINSSEMDKFDRVSQQCES